MTGCAEPVTGELYRVGGSDLTDPEDAAVYLIAFQGGAALIDAGCGGATTRLLANVAAAGVGPQDIRLLLLTHCHYDHTGGAHALRVRLGCPVVLHALDAPYLEEGNDVVSAACWYSAELAACPVDYRLQGSTEDIALAGRTVTAVHIPGHSPGSVAYVVHSEGLKVVFAQDVHGPLHPSLLSDADDYQSSLRRLLALDADVLCEGHFGIFRGKGEIERFIRSFMR